MKKSLLILLVVAMLMTALVSCIGCGQPQPTTTTPAQTTESTTPPTDTTTTTPPPTTDTTTTTTQDSPTNPPEDENCSEGLEFTLNEDGESYSVTGIGTCTDADIVIPNTYNGKPVTGIGDFAFSGCTDITSVVIRDGVASIGNGAFSGCTSLATIDFSNSVRLVGNCSFGGCAFENLSIVGLEVMGPWAFAGCELLESIVVSSTLVWVAWDAFRGCTTFDTIYYTGTQEGWNNINIDETYNGNIELFSATVYYYSETAPVVTGNFWHYVDGVPTIWQ